jgi:hypothetical protein
METEIGIKVRGEAGFHSLGWQTLVREIGGKVVGWLAVWSPNVVETFNWLEPGEEGFEELAQPIRQMVGQLKAMENGSND